MFWKKSKKKEAAEATGNEIEIEINQEVEHPAEVNSEMVVEDAEKVESEGKVETAETEEQVEAEENVEAQVETEEKTEAEENVEAQVETEAQVEAEEKVEAEAETEEQTEAEENEDDEEGLESFNESEILVNSEQEVGEKPKKKVGKKVLLVFGIIFAVLLVLYLAATAFFSQFFYYGTVIDGQDYSWKRVEDVTAYQEHVVASYQLTLVTSDGSQEVLTSADLGMSYVETEEILYLLQGQNPFYWPEMFFETYQYTTTIVVSCDEDVVATTIEGLACMVASEMVAPTDAYPEYQDGEFVIIPYTLGTEIDSENLKVAIVESALVLSAEMNLEETGCYALPALTEESQEVIEATAELNEMLQPTVTYEEGSVIDAEVLYSWLIVDGDALSYDVEKITEFVAELAETYNTVGTTRTFIAADGDEAEVVGGNYGWTVDEAGEIEQILLDLEAGVPVEREITYSKRGLTHDTVDWGDSYTEIDLTDQKVYYIENGEIVVEGDIVTGDVADGNATPQGVYSLTYKTTNAVLRGTQYADGTYEYESPVSYWMPFNGGIGMHDASWRGTFGGTIYQYSGSHGCVNMSYSTAQAIYSYVSTGSPIICHY